LDLPLAGSIANGSYQFLLYNPNATISGTTAFSSVNVSSNTASALAGYEGYIFVLGTEIKNKRVFKVTEVAMDEEGEVTVRAVEHAVDENGLSLISKGLATRVAGLFTIDGRPE
jgi:precorrin-3B methylase